MYNIIQLNDKNLSELQDIAQEMGIKKTDSLKKEELVYKILDEQAIAGATKKVAADKLKEERKGDKQKRSRVTVKKEAADKVFTANKNGELTKGKTEDAPAVQATEQAAEAAKEPAVAATPAAETEVPKRKPGRPRKVKQEAAPVAETPKTVPAETKVETTEPKKAEPKKVVAAPQPTPDESPVLPEAEDDFIPIEDLPTEKIELPSELNGKFEATKAETPIAPVAEPTPATAQRPRLRPRDNNNTPYNNNNNNNRNNNPRPVQQQRPAQQNAGDNYAPVQERRPVIEREKVL